jgi:pilus assembly protein CpaD
MYARFTPLLLAPALLLLSGCGSGNTGLESVNQPIVERNDYVLDLQASGDGLAAGEAQRLEGWLGSMDLRYGDRLAVDDGANGTAGRAEVAEQAGRYGLMLSDQAPVTVGQIAPGTVRVVLTRMSASVPDCPNHSGLSLPDFAASTNANFGCATNSNLAAMIADPADLVRGAPGAPTADTATVAKSIRALRAAPPSGAGGTTVKSEGTK